MSRAPIALPSLDVARIAMGDPNATADAIQSLSDAFNQLALQSATRVGSWKDVPYNAGDYTTNAGGAWTVDPGDLRQFEYIRVDDLLIVQLAIIGSTIGNNFTAECRIKAPAGLVLNGLARGGACVWNDPTLSGTGGYFVQAQGTIISCQRTDGTLGNPNFFPTAGGANSFNLGFCGIFHTLPTGGN